MTVKTTILYVEDNPDNRMLIRRILMVEDYEVVEARDAKEALAYVTNNHPGIVLMDINMPEMDGYTLTAELRKLEHLNDVPIVALTANVMRGDRERALAAGCDGYIQKPIDIDTIVQQIERYLKSRA